MVRCHYYPTNFTAEVTCLVRQHIHSEYLREIAWVRVLVEEGRAPESQLDKGRLPRCGGQGLRMMLAACSEEHPAAASDGRQEPRGGLCRK